MTDSVSREELQAELRALRAESDARFERIIGEVRLANSEVAGSISTLRAELTGDLSTFKVDIGGKLDVVASKSAGRFTVWGAAGAVVAAMVATVLVLLQVAQAGYDSGKERERATRDDIREAVKSEANRREAATSAKTE